MKKTYSKPEIAVESFHLDASIAGACSDPTAAIALNHELFGCNYDVYFAEGVAACQIAVISAAQAKSITGPFPMAADLNDTLCYHAALGMRVLLTS